MISIDGLSVLDIFLVVTSVLAVCLARFVNRLRRELEEKNGGRR